MLAGGIRSVLTTLDAAMLTMVLFLVGVVKEVVGRVR